MPTIVVDAMGGDLAPETAVQAVAEASLATDIDCLLVGDESRLQKSLEARRYNPEQIEIVHAPETIDAAVDARAAVRQKRKASILVAARLVQEGRGAAVVSGGNTMAALLACVRYFPLIPGVRRAALASVYPRPVEYPGQDPYALMLDVGATVRCEAAELMQFGLMGSVYARHVSKVAAPRVGLLNMGREATAGGEVLTEAHHRLAAARGIDFVGNVEGHDVVSGLADVIVCEGFLGNVAVKLMEGISETPAGAVAAATAHGWRRRLGLGMRPRGRPEGAGYGGAPILGFEHLFFRVHGRSGPPVLVNAVKVAAKAVRAGVPEEIRAAIDLVR